MTIGSHQATVGKSQVHFTPRWLWEAVGPFDVDPCAGSPRPWDIAATNYAEADDGLSREWSGRAFVNPPFNRYEVGRWVDRLAAHGSGILLVHARTETGWFERVWKQATALLFLADRISFCRADGSPHPANSGAPVVLAGFSGHDADILRVCGLAGFLVESWTALPSPVSSRAGDGP